MIVKTYKDKNIMAKGSTHPKKDTKKKKKVVAKQLTKILAFSENFLFSCHSREDGNPVCRI